MEIRRVVMVGAIAGVMLALVGCTRDPGPIVTETPFPPSSPESSPSPSPSPSPSAGPLTDEDLLAMMPPAASAPDVQGAVVTAQFFLELYAPMFHTGDTEVWDALTGATCGYCTDASQDAASLAADGWTATGGEVEPISNSIEAFLSDDGFTYVILDADLSDAILIDPDGQEDVAQTARRTQFSLQLELIGDVWRINGVATEDAEG